MKYAAVTSALFALAMPMAKAAPPALSPVPEFDGTMLITGKNGTTRAAHVSVQSWVISGERGPTGPTYELPLRGFYIAHLINGDIWTIIDGKTTRRATGDYWTVIPGAIMQVKVRGQGALLETIFVAKG
jgi:hypothetical protein